MKNVEQFQKQRKLNKIEQIYNTNYQALMLPIL